MSKDPATGTFGAPPPGAPREVSSTNVGPTPEQLLRAHQNERSLAPLVYDNVPKQVVEPPKAAVLAPREVSHQPAASNSDSPSRGIPQEILDPNKKITGGFGVAGPPQYFPLDGTELKEAVRALMDKLNARLDNSLLFNVAMTYPNVTATVSINILGYGEMKSHELKEGFAFTKNSEKLAVELGVPKVDETIEEVLRETDVDGTPANPPDRVRDELGLEKPRKQFVEMAGGRQLVDRPITLLDSF